MSCEGPATLRFADADAAPVILPPLLTIGKGAAADLVVDDDTVSRLRASIEQIGLAWVVTDLGSRNGTWVNGQRVLQDRDEILLGRTRLTFDTPGLRRLLGHKLLRAERRREAGLCSGCGI